MNRLEIKEGIALVCDRQGAVHEIVRDDFGLTRGVQAGSAATFASLLDALSRDKAAAFFEHILREGAAFNWEINVALAGVIEPLFFAGGLAGQSILLMGSKSPRETLEFYNEFLALTQSQIVTMRAMLDPALGGGVAPVCTGAFVEDFTRLNNELVNVQRELHKKNAELQRANEQKNLFLGMAAHDLRNPLGVILSYSEFLSDELAAKVDAEALDILGTMAASSRFMLDLVEQLLDISQIESGMLKLDREPTDLNQLLHKTVQLNQVLARVKQVELVVDQEDSCPSALLDRVKIIQVLNNLLTNAVKYSPTGSRVTIRLGVQGQDILLAVTDQGQGVPDDMREQIFLPFFKAGAGRQGSAVDQGEMGKSAGLGLVIVRRIVEGHGGKIWVESASSGGSTFFVRLPLVPPTSECEPVAAAAPQVQAPESGEEKTGLRVLLAEDDPFLAKMAVRILAKGGHTVRRAADGQEALELLGRHRFDLVLMDLQMPVMGGLEAARRIRAASRTDQFDPKIPIVALTGEDMRTAAKHANLEVFDRFLTKPVSVEELLRVIQEVLR